MFIFVFRGFAVVFLYSFRDFLIFFAIFSFLYRGFEAFLLSALPNQVIIGSTHSCHDAKKNQKITGSASHIA